MIVPALLTHTKEEFKGMLSLCSEFTDFVQVDIMDGLFVSSRSITPIDIRNVATTMKTEAHLMVNKPLEYLDVFKNFGAHKIIFHFEIDEDHRAIIQAIKGAGLEAGLAINPYTQIADFNHLVDEVASILFMSVIPGFYGAAFVPEVLDKIVRFKKIYPATPIGIDGGVKLDNVARIKEAGVDYLCVGSAILKAKDPVDAYKKFVEACNE
ncbi:MAG: ribulose-phosphate 3-epimerase [Candidatus Omnitrophota bacterium]|nr:ribulose-phosphate 3-epimerase [Candidatus Omnitrophota bacterium]